MGDWILGKLLGVKQSLCGSSDYRWGEGGETFLKKEYFVYKKLDAEDWLDYTNF